MGDIATAILTQLSTVAGGRVYPEYVREADNTYPLCVYHYQINPVNSFDGLPGIRYAILTIAAIDATYAGATATAKAVETAIEGKSGTWDGVYVQGVFLQQDGVSDDVVTEPTTEQILAFVKTMTFDIAYSY